MVKRGSDILERLNKGDLIKGPGDLSGGTDIMAGKRTFWLGETDVLFQEWNGGGGYGDPIERDPESVKADIANGLVSLKYARQVYGVVVEPDTGEIDRGKTLARKRHIRNQRVRVTQSATDMQRNDLQRQGADKPSHRLGEYVSVRKVEGKWRIFCQQCGRMLSDAGENYKLHVPMAEYPLTRANPRNSKTKRFVLREFYCPGCATRIEVDMNLKGAPLIWSYRLKLD
ncbi:MAG: Hydantoin utilization protein B [Dehalococcoidia bacterium]|nr:Hydantoin utilization protein B [Dehalococcoidia bacterium]